MASCLDCSFLLVCVSVCVGCCRSLHCLLFSILSLAGVIDTIATDASLPTTTNSSLDHGLLHGFPGCTDHGHPHGLCE